MQKNNKQMSKEENLKRVDELSSGAEENKRTKTKDERLKSVLCSLTVYILLLGIFLIPIILARYRYPSENAEDGKGSEMKCSVYISESGNGALKLKGGHIYAVISELAVSNAGSNASYTYNLNLRLSENTDGATYGEPAVMEYGYGCIGTIKQGLLNYMDSMNFLNIDSFRGKSLPYITAHNNLSRSVRMKAVCQNEKCINCGRCIAVCRDSGFSAIEHGDEKASVNHTKCDGCGLCTQVCPTNALSMVTP